MSKLRKAFCRTAPSLFRCAFSFLFMGVVTAGCKKAPEVKSTETKVAEPVAAEITPPGWIRPELNFLRKPGLDLAGPAAVPDGEPDLVLEVILEPALLKEVAKWEVHGNASLGSWTSAPNKHGWWLIKTDLEPDQNPKAKRSRIRLCFPDNNDPRLTRFTVKASQANGALLFQQTVSK